MLTRCGGVWQTDVDMEEHFHMEEVVDEPLRAAWQLFDRCVSWLAVAV
jgi:hypothetical protein